MWLVWLLIGFVAGGFVGVVLAAWASVLTDEKAVADGVIKLCGSFYKIDKIF